MTGHVRLDAYLDATPADPADPSTPIAVSAFAGVGGFDLGLEAAGIHTAVQIEWDAAASRVLAARFPDAARFSDVREVTADAVSSALGGRRPDVLVGGFPCQDLSVAGRRAGLAGERSGLYGELLRLARDLDPDWLVVENVPGLLSSAGGDGDALDEHGARAEGEGDDADPGAGPVPVRPGAGVRGSDFALFLGDLTGFEPAVPAGGWRSSGVAHGPRGTCAWRVLDAQHFGVAQRRRRVFVVFHPRDRAAPAAVLLEPEGVRRHPSSGRPPRPRASRAAGDAAVRERVAGARGGGAPDVHAVGVAEDGRARVGADAAGLTADRDLTTALTGGFGSGGPDPAHAQAGWLVPTVPEDDAGVLPVAGALTRSSHTMDDAGVGGGQLVPLAADMRNGTVDEDVAMTLQAGGKAGERGRSINSLPHVVEGVPDRASALRSRHSSRGPDSSARETLVPYAVSGGGGDDADLRAVETEQAETLTTRGAWAGTQGGTLAVGHDPGDVSPTVTSKWAKGSGGPAGNETGNLVATPLQEVGARTGKSTDDPRAGLGVGEPGDPMFTLQASQQHGVGVDVYNGETTGDVAHTVRGGHDQGVPRVIDGAMGVTAKGNGEAYLSEHAPTLAGQGGMPGQGYAAVVQRDAYEVDKERGLPNDEGIKVTPTDVAPTITADGDPTERTDRGLRIVEPGVATYRKSKRAQTDQDDETWVEADVANTLNTHDNSGDTRATEIVVGDPVTFAEGKTGQAVSPTAPTLTARQPSDGSSRQTAVVQPVAFHAQQDPTASDLSPTVSGGQGSSPVGVAVPINADALRGPGAAATPSPDAEGRVRLRDPGLGIGEPGDPAGTLAAAGPGAVARPAAAVRRLTPTECERLQGFPDGWTDVPGTSDSARYKQLGNAVAVPCAAWLGWRIQLYRRGLLTW